MTQEIITPSAKLEFSHLITSVPLDSEYNAGKFASLIWIEKTSDFRAKLEVLFEEAKREKWGDKVPTKVALPKIIDGDESSYTNDEGELVYPNLKMFGFRVGSKRKPVVVDSHGEPIVNEELLGYTLRGQVKINAYGWEFGKTRKGVSIGLGAVMLTDLGVSASGGGIEGFEFQESA